MNIGRRSLIYFLALGLYLISKDIEISAVYYTVPGIPGLLELLRYASYALVIFVSVFMTRYTLNILKRYVMLLSVFLLISLTLKSVTILFNFIFIFAAKDIPLKRMIKFVMSFQIIITFLIFLGSITGVIADWTYLIDGRFRHSMGYGYPNAIPTIYFYTMIAACYLMEKRFKIWHLILFETINFVLFYFTDTRTAFALTAIALVVFWGCKYRKKKLKSTRFTRLVYVHSVYLIAIFAVAACYFFNPANPVLKTIDAFISNRLSMGHNALMINRLTLFGQRIEWFGFGGVGYTVEKLAGEYNNVDCSYVKILLDNGIIMLLLSVTGYMLVANEELKKGNRYFCVALLFANLYAMIEPRYIETGFNPFVWCLSVLIVTDVYLAIKRYNILKLKYRNLVKECVRKKRGKRNNVIKNSAPASHFASTC